MAHDIVVADGQIRVLNQDGARAFLRILERLEADDERRKLVKANLERIRAGHVAGLSDDEVLAAIQLETDEVNQK